MTTEYDYNKLLAHFQRAAREKPIPEVEETPSPTGLPKLPPPPPIEEKQPTPPPVEKPDLTFQATPKGSPIGATFSAIDKAFKYFKDYYTTPLATLMTLPWSLKREDYPILQLPESIKRVPGWEHFFTEVPEEAAEGKTVYTNPAQLLAELAPSGRYRKVYEEWKAPKYVKGGVEFYADVPIYLLGGKAIGAIPIKGVPIRVWETRLLNKALLKVSNWRWNRVLKGLDTQTQKLVIEQLDDIIRENPQLAQRATPELVAKIAGGMKDIQTVGSVWQKTAGTHYGLKGLPKIGPSSFAMQGAKSYARFMLEFGGPQKPDYAVTALKSLGFTAEVIQKMTVETAWNNLIDGLGVVGVAKLMGIVIPEVAPPIIPTIPEIGKIIPEKVTPITPEVTIQFENVTPEIQSLHQTWVRELPANVNLDIERIRISPEAFVGRLAEEPAFYSPMDKRITFKSIKEASNKEIFLHEISHNVARTLTNEQLTEFIKEVKKLPSRQFVEVPTLPAHFREVFEDMFPLYLTNSPKLIKDAPNVVIFFEREFPKRVAIPKAEVVMATGKYYVRGDFPSRALGIGGTWATSSLDYAKAYGKELSFVVKPKNVLELNSMDELSIRYGEGIGWEEARVKMMAEGYDAVRISNPKIPFKGIIGADEIWIFRKPKLLSLSELAIPKAEVVPEAGLQPSILEEVPAVEAPVIPEEPTIPPPYQPPTGETLFPISPLGKPRTLNDLNREAKGMRAMTPEQRAEAMDIARPIAEDDLLWKVKPFEEHAKNLLGSDTPIKRALRDTPGLKGLKQIVSLWNTAQMQRDNPTAYIGIQKAIWEEIETGRARIASMAWYNDAEELFGVKKVKGKWIATKLQVASGVDTTKPYFRTILDITDHPSNYNFTPDQAKCLKVIQDVQNQLLRDAQRVGVNATELSEEYWRRIVTKGPKEKMNSGWITKRISGRKGYIMQRAFEFVDDGVALGYEYETNWLTTLQDRLEAGIRTISNQETRHAIAGLPGVEKPLERLESKYPQTIEGWKTARQARDATKNAYITNKAVENEIALRQAEADYITAMREVFIKKIEVGQPGYYELRLPSGRIAPRELVEEVQKYIDLPELRIGNRGSITNLTLEITQLLRSTLTNVDLAAGFIQGQTLFYRNNPAWWIAQGNAVISVARDFHAYVAKNFALMDEGIRAGAISIPTEFMFAKQGIGSIPTKIPVIGRGMNALNRGFEGFILIGQTELFRSLRSGVLRRATGEITPVGVELEKEAMDALVSLGSTIRKEVGTESYAILGVRPTQRMVEQLSFFAARFMRANLGLLGKAFTGGEGGREARRALGALIAGATALTIAITWLTKKRLPNLTDPFAPDWMQVSIGRTYFNCFGPFYTYFRTIARMSVLTAQGKPELAVLQLVGFLNSKAGILYRAIDLTGQLVYKGKARTWEGEVIPRTPLGISKGLLGELAVPISIQEALTSLPEGRPEALIGEIWGLTSRGSPYSQMDILFHQQADINPEGISYRYAEAWQEKEMEKRFPEIAKMLVGRGSGVWADASQMWEEVEEKYYAREEALEAEFLAGERAGTHTRETLTEFRDIYAQIQNDRVVEKLGINKAVGLFQDEKDLPTEPNDRALAEYYLIYDRATKATGAINWDIVDALTAYYELTWTAEQRTFVERNTGLRNHPSLILEYLQAKEQLRPYWEIPEVPKELRQAYRREHPEIDAILVRWYGYKPTTGEEDVRRFNELLRGTTEPTKEYDEYDKLLDLFKSAVPK